VIDYRSLHEETRQITRRRVLDCIEMISLTYLTKTLSCMLQAGKNSVLPRRKGICFCVSLAIRGSKSKQCCHHFAKLTETGNVEIPHFYKARKVLTSTFVPQHLEPATNKSGYPWFVKPKMKIFAARVIHISLHVYGFAFSYIRNYLKKSFIENVCCYMKRITGP